MSDTVSTILILAVVAMFEGVRRVAPGAFVLRRVLFGRWRVARPLELGRDYFLVAWPIPITLPLVVDSGSKTIALTVRRQQARIRARVRRIRAVTIALRALGTLILLTLVIGVPMATLRWDVWGLVMSLEVLLLLCVMQAMLTYLGIRRAGAASRPALWPSLRMIWPFTAPRASEAVMEHVVSGTSTIVVCDELLGRDALLRALRPRVYDEFHARDDSSGVLALYGRDMVAGFLRTPPAEGGHPFCPRCGSGYQAEVRECRDCDGVALASAR